jgi:hypothetical protein
MGNRCPEGRGWLKMGEYAMRMEIRDEDRMETEIDTI